MLRELWHESAPDGVADEPKDDRQASVRVVRLPEERRAPPPRSGTRGGGGAGGARRLVEGPIGQVRAYYRRCVEALSGPARAPAPRRVCGVAELVGREQENPHTAGVAPLPVRRLADHDLETTVGRT